MSVEESMDERRLLDALLAHIETRRTQAHQRFQDLARRRIALPRMEPSSARERLRLQAAEISAELVRLRLADALARTLLWQASSRFEPAPDATAAPMALTGLAAKPTPR
jgi:hypothetical protein